MDQYAIYVWISYGIGVLLLFGLFGVSLTRYRKIKQKMKDPSN